MRVDDHAAKLAQAMLQFRRSRAKTLPPVLFAEPAWELLLSLFVADAEGHQLTGRRVIGDIDTPPPVMSRWLMHLSQTGLIIGDGSGDLDDPLTLSATAFESLETILAEARVLIRELG